MGSPAPDVGLRRENMSVQAGQCHALRVPLQFTVALAFQLGAAAISADTNNRILWTA